MKFEIRNLRLILFLVLCFAFAVNTNAKSQFPDSTFEHANKFYIEKNYDEAIKIYESLIRSGNNPAQVYFNLGNAYYKNGNNATAILNYERAKRLNPTDEDIDFNLRLANLGTIDKIEPAPQVFYVKWWNDFVNSASIEDHSRKGLLFIWIAFILACLYILINYSLIKRIAFFGTFILLFTGLFTLYLSHKQFNELNERKAALIISSGVYIKSSPDEKSINLFMLHSGTRVEVIDELQAWKRIRIANGNEGWLPSNAIENI